MQPRRAAHMDWLLAQHRTGRVLFSGPTSDNACGIYVLLAADMEEAKRLAGQDPYHLHGDRVPQVFEWKVQRAMRLDGPSIADIERMAGAVGTP